MEAVALAAIAGGVTMSVVGQLRQGKQTQELANARAAIDIENAKFAKERADEEARMKAEQGQAIVEKQKMLAAASNIRVDVGAPLVLEATTKANILKDIDYILQGGEQAERSYMSSAGIEKATGRYARTQGYWGALSSGLSGYGSLAYMGMQGGGLSSSKEMYPESKGFYPTAKQGAIW